MKFLKKFIVDLALTDCKIIYFQKLVWFSKTPVRTKTKWFSKFGENRPTLGGTLNVLHKNWELKNRSQVHGRYQIALNKACPVLLLIANVQPCVKLHGFVTSRNWFDPTFKGPQWTSTQHCTSKDGWYVMRKQFSVEFQSPS